MHVLRWPEVLAVAEEELQRGHSSTLSVASKSRTRTATTGADESCSIASPGDESLTSRAAPDNPTGLRAYAESYAYDLVGNILQLQHQAPAGNWTRHYDYAAAGNRLLATSAPGDGPGVFSHAYQYNAHGSMTAMPHLAQVDWDHADRMHSADLGGGGTVWFLYDSAGNRVRKIRVNQAGTSTNERIYLGGYEVYREHVGPELRLERQTLHVADDSGRICLVETKTVDDADVVPLPANISRYQYGNHLGSVGMELDETGLLISYEEFHPYGTTAYRASNSAIDVSPSRYRYTGQERDEETGLGHHGARYYASWLGRWTAADPIGLGDGLNRFAYVGGNPVRAIDPSGQAGELYEDPGTDQHATINADIQALTSEYMSAETEAERQVIKETIGILRDVAGYTAHLEPVPVPSWMEEARRNKQHADEAVSKIGERRDALSKSAMAGTAVIMAAGATATAVGLEGAAAVAGTTLEGTVVGGAMIGAAGGLAGGVVEGAGLEVLDQVQRNGEVVSWTSVGDAAATSGLIGAATGGLLGGLLHAVPSPHSRGQARIMRQPAPRSQSGTIEVGAAAKGGVNVSEVLTKPESLWGKSPGEVASAFSDAGYEATIRTSRSGRAQIIGVSGHPEVTQIQIHPGGGRHGGAYVKISTSTGGKVKIVNPETYKPTPGEKARVVPFIGGQR